MIDLEILPAPVQFAYIAMTKSAIGFKKMGYDKDFFLFFAKEIWYSMEMTDMDHLNDVLQQKIKKDINPYVDAYIKNKNMENK